MRRRAPGLEIECPQCKARSVFQRTAFPRIDSSGFECYSLKCQNCGAALVGIIDPFDDKLLLSVDAETNVKSVPDPPKVY
jgi:uncharacterized Zn finger protein